MRGDVMQKELQEACAEPPADPGRSDPGAAARKRAAIELIRSHRSVLEATARRYSICLDDADDAFQRGLEILLEKAPTTETRQLVPWARTVIKHEALAVRRGRERTLGRPSLAAASEVSQDWVELIPSERDGPEEQAVGREKVARSREALARLKPHELKALTQLAEGYSYAEIGAMNNWTRTKVNRCLAEGRQRFRSAFRESETGGRCDAVRPLLSACCDRELDRARLAEVEDHLAVCGGCRATLRAYRAAPKAAAALAPVLPASRGLWDRLQEIMVAAHSKVQAIGGDPSGAGAGAAGAARGVAPAAVAKVAAICAGTGATAAICVATGVLPTPVLAPQPDSRPNHSPEPVTRIEEPPPQAVTEPAAGPAPPGAGAPSPANPGRAATRPNADQPKPPAPAPAPTATEAEFTPEAAGTPVPAAASPSPPPAPAPAGGGSGVPVGGGGEFGP